MKHVELVGPAPAYLEAVIDHWTDLGLDTSIPERLAVQVGTLHVSHRFGEHRYEAGQVTIFEVRDSWGRTLIDVVCPEADLPLWRVPLLSPDTVEIEAHRRGVTLTVPAINDVAIVLPRTPRYQIGQFVKPPVADDAPDYPEPPEWQERLPGVAPGYPLGWITRIGDVRYVQEGTLAQLPAGNFNVPGTIGSLWRAIAQGGGLDPWDAGALYQVGDEVAHAGKDWLNRRPNNSFEPGTTQAGWLQIGPGDGPFPWLHVGNEGVPLGWQVTHNGRLWQAGSDNLFWEPGVFGWTDIGPAP